MLQRTPRSSSRDELIGSGDPSLAPIVAALLHRSTASTRSPSIANLPSMAQRQGPADPIERFLPGSYALHVLSVTRRWGVTSEDLFSDFGLDEQSLEAPDSRIPLPIVSEIIRKARRLTNEPGLGILIGLETHTNTYGYLGFATMSALSLGQAIEVTARYSPVVTTAFTFRLNRVDGIAGLIADEQCDMGDVRDVIVLGLLVGMRMIGCALTGRAPWRPIDVAFPEPAYYARFAHLVPELRFGQPINQIVLLDSDLELPLLMPDRAALRLAVEQCEQGMQTLGLGARIDQRTLLVLQRDGALDFEKVASALHLSPRTLKRRLAECGVTFSELVEKARCERALLLLRSPDLSLDDVADRLGYSTVSNLVRAFHRWTGMTPAAYRRGVSQRLSVHLPLRR